MAAYVVGVATGTLVADAVKPYLREMLKATIGIALQAKQVAMEAAEELQDLTVEVAADNGTGSAASRTGSAASRT